MAKRGRKPTSFQVEVTADIFNDDDYHISFHKCIASVNRKRGVYGVYKISVNERNEKVLKQFHEFYGNQDLFLPYQSMFQIYECKFDQDTVCFISYCFFFSVLFLSFLMFSINPIELLENYWKESEILINIRQNRIIHQNISYLLIYHHNNLQENI